MLSYLLTETTILLKHMLELAFLVGSVCLIVHPQVVFIGQREGPNSDNIYILLLQEQRPSFKYKMFWELPNCLIFSNRGCR